MSSHLYQSRMVVEAHRVPTEEMDQSDWLLEHGTIAGWLMRWLGDAWCVAEDVGYDLPNTRHGSPLHAAPGDWIIRSKDNDFRVLDHDTFVLQFEAIP